MPEPTRSSAILVLDAEGSVFARLRELGLRGSLWRVTDVRRLAGLGGMDLGVYAAYGQVEWPVADALAARCTTVVLASQPSRSDARDGFAHGLAGYLDASLATDVLRRALTGVLNGELAYGRDIIGSWLREMREGGRSRAAAALTPRQQQIVALIAQGASDKEIGGALGIATATAQKHVTNILERLRVPNRAAAVAAVSARMNP
ncbi:MAG TPA: LuxR C-terminal-related transcriptional regulator [Candidatus Limnocylindria bacterium]